MVKTGDGALAQGETPAHVVSASLLAFREQRIKNKPSGKWMF